MDRNTDKYNEPLSRIEEGRMNSREFETIANKADGQDMFLPGELDKDEGRMHNGELGGGLTMTDE